MTIVCCAGHGWNKKAIVENEWHYRSNALVSSIFNRLSRRDKRRIARKLGENTVDRRHDGQLISLVVDILQIGAAFLIEFSEESRRTICRQSKGRNSEYLRAISAGVGLCPLSPLDKWVTSLVNLFRHHEHGRGRKDNDAKTVRKKRRWTITRWTHQMVCFFVCEEPSRPLSWSSIWNESTLQRFSFYSEFNFHSEKYLL